MIPHCSNYNTKFFVWKYQGLANYSSRSPKALGSWTTYLLPRHLGSNLSHGNPAAFVVMRNHFWFKLANLNQLLRVARSLCCVHFAGIPISTSFNYSRHQARSLPASPSVILVKAGTPLTTLHSCSILMTCNQFFLLQDAGYTVLQHRLCERLHICW